MLWADAAVHSPTVLRLDTKIGEIWDFSPHLS